MASNQANDAHLQTILSPCGEQSNVQARELWPMREQEAGLRDYGLCSSISDPSSVLRDPNSREERLGFIMPAWEKSGTGLIWSDEWGPTGWVNPEIKERDPTVKLPGQCTPPAEFVSGQQKRRGVITVIHTLLQTGKAVGVINTLINRRDSFPFNFHKCRWVTRSLKTKTDTAAEELTVYSGCLNTAAC